MRYLFLALYPIAVFCQPVVEESEPIQTSTLFFELGEITAPPSSYTDAWDPKQELPIILPGGKRVEEKDLIVGIEKISRTLKSESEEDHENNEDQMRQNVPYP